MKKQKKTFILGLGHQKCGTTWLHKYLAQYPNFDRGFAKEYHIWDALDLELLENKKVKLNVLERCWNTPKAFRYKMQTKEEFYFDYFESLFSETINITADITPSYSGLAVQRLKFIKERFNRRDVEVKPLILIRDPLSRIKSAVRFNLDREKYHEGINFGEKNFDNALKQYYTNEHCVLRTKYDEIICNAFQVFGEDRVYVGFYENMFTPSEIERLSNYSGVSPRIEFAHVKVNETKGKVVESEVDEMVKEFYSEVYDFCYERFPITKELWRR